jgi:hypothetical protein
MYDQWVFVGDEYGMKCMRASRALEHGLHILIADECKVEDMIEHATGGW